MPVAPLKELVDEALAKGYAVPAINVVDELSLRAVVDAAVELRSPLIVQTSVKTVKSVGRDVVKAMFDATVAPIPVPVSLHLDHCPDRAVISSCLEAGWNSVLFDASALPVEENQRQTVEVVAEARTYGAHVEGEIEGITGVEDGVGSDTEAEAGSDRPPPRGRDESPHVPVPTFEELLVSAVQPPVDGIHLSRELPNPRKSRPTSPGSP
jgi:fructose-bisphosphate aldolase class II